MPARPSRPLSFFLAKPLHLKHRSICSVLPTDVGCPECQPDPDTYAPLPVTQVSANALLATNWAGEAGAGCWQQGWFGGRGCAAMPKGKECGFFLFAGSGVLPCFVAGREYTTPGCVRHQFSPLSS